MFKSLEKTWPIISILLTLAILASIFFLPAAARPLALAVMLLGLAVTVLLTVRRHILAHREGKISRAQLAGRIAADVPGVLLTMAAVIPAGAFAGQAAGGWAGKAAEARWPGSGTAVGVVAGILVGAAAGGGVGALVKGLWGKLTGPRQPASVREAA
jgi:hypothetical protein